MCASLAGGSQAALRRFTWLSAAIASSCSRRIASAGGPPAAAAPRLSTDWPPTQGKVQKLVRPGRRPSHLGTSLSRLSPDPRVDRDTSDRLRLGPGSHADGYQTTTRRGHPFRARGAAGTTTSIRSVRYMPRDEVCSVLATDRYIGALYDSQSGHLHPLNYTLGLAAAGERAGVQIFEGTRALDFTNTAGSATGGTARIRTAGGEVRSRFVVLSGNVYWETRPAHSRPRSWRLPRISLQRHRSAPSGPMS